MPNSTQFSERCFNCSIDKQACHYGESPGMLRCARCKATKKWCLFLCKNCENKKRENENKELENKKRFNPCENCAMTKTDSSENYIIVQKHYIQYPNNSPIEITP
ncbi:2632_t:CDS:2, partial [Racocetra persica]